MFALCVFVASLLTLLDVEVIPNIQCYLFTRKTQFYEKINAKEYCQDLYQNHW